MGVVGSVPDDEIAAEFAAAWVDPDDAPPAPQRASDQPHAGRPPGAVTLRRRRDPATLAQAAELARPVSLARDQLLPLSPAFTRLLPEGLPRRATVTVAGQGATSLALALTAATAQAGSWLALVGLPHLGLAAAAEHGYPLRRLVVIHTPPPAHWGTVMASIVGAFEIILFGPPPAVQPVELRRLMARARERGTALVQIDTPTAAHPASRTPTGAAQHGLEADLRFTVRTMRWDGLEAGHGLLRRRRALVEVTGRRGAARRRRADLWLPDHDGHVRPIDAHDHADTTTLPAHLTAAAG